MRQAALFDIIPDVAYFAKDRDGRYTSVNEALVLRCGKQHKHELIGRPRSSCSGAARRERRELSVRKRGAPHAAVTACHRA